MIEPLIKRNNLLGPKVVEALKRRQFDAYYVADKKNVAEKVLELIPQNDVVSWGGTTTVEQLGIKKLLKDNGYSVIDRDSAKSLEEKLEKMRNSLNCDTFLMSSNAITEKGELFNIDRVGNRVAALCFGPKSVIIIAGMNKIVPDMEAAYSKVRHYTSPINAQRFCDSTPCSKTGECADCLSPQCCCAQMVATRFCFPAGKIKIVLVNDELGI